MTVAFLMLVTMKKFMVDIIIIIIIIIIIVIIIIMTHPPAKAHMNVMSWTCRNQGE